MILTIYKEGVLGGLGNTINPEDFKNVIGVFEADPTTTLSRATNQDRFNVFKIIGEKANDVRLYDTVKIESRYVNTWGSIVEIESSSVSDDIVEITIGLGTDGFLFETALGNFDRVFTYSNIVSNLTTWFQNQRPISRSTFDIDTSVPAFSGYIQFAEGNSPTFSQAVRQLGMQSVRVTYDILSYPSGSQRVGISFRKVTSPTFDINMDGVITWDFNSSSDTYNKISFAYVDKDDPKLTAMIAPVATYVLTKTGTWVSVNSGTPLDQWVLPLQMRWQVLATSLTELEDDTQKALAPLSYQNNCTITVDEDYLYFDQLFPNKEDLFQSLGNRGHITLPNGVSTPTYIEEIEVRESTIKITFGIGAKKLFDRLRR